LPATIRTRARALIGDLSPIFWVLWWGLLVNRMASFVGIFLALFLRERHGFDEAQAGWVVGLWGLGGTLAAPLGGLLTDRLGRRATMLLGLVAGGLSVVAIAIAARPLILATLSFLGGATQSLYHPAANATVADLVPAPERPRAYGHLYWAGNLGLAFGFLVAGLVPSRLLVFLFLADAGTTFLFAGIVASRIPETRPALLVHQPAISGLLRVARDRVFVRLLLLHVLGLVVFTQFQLALPLDMAAHGVGSRGFSWVMAFNCIGVVLLQPWLTPPLRRADPSRLLAISAVLFGMGYATNAFVSRLPFYLLGAALWTVGEVVGFPAASALVANLAPLELRGRYQGAFTMTWGLAMTLSPVVGGQVMRRLGAPPLWYGCLAAGALVAAGHLLCASERRRRLADVAAAAQCTREAGAAG